MYLSNQNLLVIILVGVIAGWLAGKIVRGAGYGLIADMAIGMIGAFIGQWLLSHLHIRLGTGIVSAIVNATMGAVVLLAVLKLLLGGGGGWWSRWGR
jgi:uncharacterized membrane protein YeaQ/YmgE (transglycosylase-associated protein family)